MQTNANNQTHTTKHTNRQRHLVHDHVLELLVEHGPGEDVVHQRLPPRSGSEHVLADVAVASLNQSLRGGGEFGVKETTT